MEYAENPYIIEENNIIVEINDAFLNLTKFTREELLNRCTSYVWKDCLRINVGLDFIGNKTEAIYFTKSLDVRFVTIIRNKDKSKNKIKYVFIERADSNSQFDEKIQFINKLITDNRIGVAIFTAPDFMLIKSNTAYMNYFDKPFNSKELAYGKYIHDFIPNYAGSSAEKELKKLVEANQSIYLRAQRRLFASDKTCYWDNIIIPISEKQNVRFIISLVNNVTEETYLRENIKLKNKQLEAVLSGVNDILEIIDNDGNPVMENRLMDTICNKYKLTDLNDIEKNVKFYELDELETESRRLPIDKIFSDESSDKRKIKAEVNGKIGYYETNVKPIFDENGEIIYRVVILHDITEEINKIRIIEQQKKELEIIFENINDGLVVVDKDGRFIRANRTVKEIIDDERPVTEITTEELERILKSSVNHYSENGRKLTYEDSPYFKVIKGEKVIQQRIVIVNGNGKKYIDFNGTPVFDKNGDFQYGVILCHDVTDNIQKENEIKRQQQLLIESEKEKRETLENALVMKDEFISLISHEFKTPLNVIFSAIQLIEHKYYNRIPEDIKNLLGTIKHNTFRQMRLVNNLLDATRLNSGRLKLRPNNTDIVFLTKAVTQSVSVYAMQKDIGIYFKSNVKSKIISIDDEKYERIILNLLSNALKFTEEGGRITVTLNEMKNTNMIRIRVKDTGIGIPEEKREQIFQRFVQVDSNLSRQAEGTGIGLFIVKSLVNLMGGTIKLESKLGEGSTFIIELPVKEPVLQQKKEACLNMDNRVINQTNIEFSDIYL